MESNRFFLCSFSPLCRKPRGREAIAKHQYAPFVDGSCRREPDLEHRFPAISALCRKAKFAPKLSVVDGVVYIGKKSKYHASQRTCWPLVAILKVAHRFGSHRDAANWYGSKGYELPNKCMVDENPPEISASQFRHFFKIASASPQQYNSREQCSE